MSTCNCNQYCTDKVRCLSLLYSSATKRHRFVWKVKLLSVADKLRLRLPLCSCIQALAYMPHITRITTHFITTSIYVHIHIDNCVAFFYFPATLHFSCTFVIYSATTTHILAQFIYISDIITNFKCLCLCVCVCVSARKRKISKRSKNRRSWQ